MRKSRATRALSPQENSSCEHISFSLSQTNDFPVRAFWVFSQSLGEGS